MTLGCRRRFSSLLALLVGGLVLSAPAQSRIWSHSPADLARDYLVITDNRGGGDNVFVFWMAPPMFSSPTPNRALHDILSKYVVVSVSRSHVSKEGSMSFDTASSLQVDDASGHPLTALNSDTIPPTVVGTLATLQTMMGRSFGPFGKGIQWFVFDTGAVQVCGEGGLAVKFTDQVYTYSTPIPGCSGS